MRRRYFIEVEQGNLHGEKNLSFELFLGHNIILIKKNWDNHLSHLRFIFTMNFVSSFKISLLVLGGLLRICSSVYVFIHTLTHIYICILYITIYIQHITITYIYALFICETYSFFKWNLTVPTGIKYIHVQEKTDTNVHK